MNFFPLTPGTAPRRVVLASTSPHRRLLLARLGLGFDCEAPEVAETPQPGEAPADRALRLALAKADAVARRHPAALVIGSDQVASLDTGSPLPQILRKPGSRERCQEQLGQMSGHWVRFDTAVAVVTGPDRRTHLDCTRVRLRALSRQDIDSYIEREPAFDCAGGFKCEGLGVTLFEKIETQDPTALIGLPLIWLCQALREAGVSV